MKILIDENLPRALTKQLKTHEAITVQQRGWSGIKNGELLKRANQEFKVLLTSDKNMKFQQNVRNLNLAIIVFPSNRLEIVMNLVGDLERTLNEIKSGQIIEL